MLVSQARIRPDLVGPSGQSVFDVCEDFRLYKSSKICVSCPTTIGFKLTLKLVAFSDSLGDFCVKLKETISRSISAIHARKNVNDGVVRGQNHDRLPGRLGVSNLSISRSSHFVAAVGEHQHEIANDLRVPAV